MVIKTTQIHEFLEFCTTTISELLDSK